MLDSFPLVLAIEFPITEQGVAQHARYFDRSIAGALANQLSFEIAKHLPSLDGLGLVWMAACYDQAQILRPEFPIHTSLLGLYQSGVRDGQPPQVMTLQALRGQAPMPVLQVDESLLGGPLVLVPFALVGEAALVKKARAILEDKLLDSGLADARTAMMLNQALAADAEHARLMTLDDLAALCSIQLDNAGLAEVWMMIERTLFHPASSFTGVFDSIPYQVLDKQVRLQLPSPAESAAPDTQHAQTIMRALQASAILRAHGINVLDSLSATGALDTHEDYWIDWHLDNEVAQIQAMRASTSVFGYQLLNAQGTRIAWATPRTAKASAQLKTRFAHAVFSVVDIASQD